MAKSGYDAYSRFCLPDPKKLFFLKAIRLKRGLALIPKLNHLAGDGYSYFYFLSLLAIPIDVRRQVKEYGPRFLGNGIMLHTMTLNTESVRTLPAKEIAIIIRKSMPSMSRETYLGYLTGIEDIIASGKIEELRPFDPDGGVLVTNLSRLPVEKLNFGTGCPDLIIPLTTGRNSAAILTKKENFILRYAY